METPAGMFLDRDVRRCSKHATTKAPYLQAIRRGCLEAPSAGAPQLKHGETERRMTELELAVKQLQVERDALAIKAETLERCILQGENAVDAVRNHPCFLPLCLTAGTCTLRSIFACTCCGVSIRSEAAVL